MGWRLDGQDQLILVFQHTLREPLTQIVFKQRDSKHPQVDISSLARAAVAGDEKALDLFSAWRPRTAGNRFPLNSQGQDSLCFYVTSLRGKRVHHMSFSILLLSFTCGILCLFNLAGIIYYLSESGSCSEVLNTDGLIVRKLLYHHQKDHLIIVTEGLTVTQYQTDSEGSLSELSKVSDLTLQIKPDLSMQQFFNHCNIFYATGETQHSIR